MFDYEGLPQILEEAAEAVEAEDYEVESFRATLYDLEQDQYRSMDSAEEPIANLVEELDAAFIPELTVRPDGYDQPDNGIDVMYHPSEDNFKVHAWRSKFEDRVSEVEEALEEHGFDIK